MSSQLGNLTIASMVQTKFAVPNQGVKGIIIGNESGLTCTITMESGGVSKTLYPSTVDWFQVNPGFSGNILINPVNILNNVTSFPASKLIFDAIGVNDPEQASMYPLSLNRVTNQGNSATVPGASTSIVNDGNAANTQILEATVAGDGSSAVTLTNDAKLTLGTTLHPGSVSLDNGKITSNGAGALQTVQTLFTTGSLTAIRKAGPFAVSTVLTSFAHNLGVTPDMVIPIIDAGSTQPHQCYVKISTLDATNVQLQGDGFLTVYIISIKF